VSIILPIFCLTVATAGLVGWTSRNTGVLSFNFSVDSLLSYLNASLGEGGENSLILPRPPLFAADSTADAKAVERDEAIVDTENERAVQRNENSVIPVSPHLHAEYTLVCEDAEVKAVECVGIVAKPQNLEQERAGLPANASHEDVAEIKYQLKPGSYQIDKAMCRLLESLANATVEDIGSSIRGIKLWKGSFPNTRYMPTMLLERPFYANLYTCIRRKDKVLLVGNSGIGKTMFGYYFLARLLNPSLFKRRSGEDFERVNTVLTNWGLIDIESRTAIRSTEYSVPITDTTVWALLDSPLAAMQSEHLRCLMTGSDHLKWDHSDWHKLVLPAYKFDELEALRKYMIAAEIVPADEEHHYNNATFQERHAKCGGILSATIFRSDLSAGDLGHAVLSLRHLPTGKLLADPSIKFWHDMVVKMTSGCTSVVPKLELNYVICDYLTDMGTSNDSFRISTIPDTALHRHRILDNTSDMIIRSNYYIKWQELMVALDAQGDKPDRPKFLRELTRQFYSNFVQALLSEGLTVSVHKKIAEECDAPSMCNFRVTATVDDFCSRWIPLMKAVDKGRRSWDSNCLYYSLSPKYLPFVDFFFRYGTHKHFVGVIVTREMEVHRSNDQFKAFVMLIGMSPKEVASFELVVVPRIGDVDDIVVTVPSTVAIVSVWKLLKNYK
jgi:hypothetical protein